MTINRIDLADERSSQGPTSGALRSSLDGFGANLATWSPAAAATTRQFTVTGFDNLTSSVEFRIYGFQAGNATGDYALTTNGAFPGVQVQGAIPELATLVMARRDAGSVTSVFLSRQTNRCYGPIWEPLRFIRTDGNWLKR